jgi:hypothetical protein
LRFPLAHGLPWERMCILLHCYVRTYQLYHFWISNWFGGALLWYTAKQKQESDQLLPWRAPGLGARTCLRYKISILCECQFVPRDSYLAFPFVLEDKSTLPALPSILLWLDEAPCHTWNHSCMVSGSNSAEWKIGLPPNQAPVDAMQWGFQRHSFWNTPLATSQRERVILFRYVPGLNL